MTKDIKSPGMGGGSGANMNPGSSKEFLVKGNQVFDALNPNVPLGIIKNFQSGATTEGGLGGASSYGKTNPSSNR